MFGDGRDEYLVVVAYPLVDLLQQVIDLVVRDPHFEWRINQSCRPDQLFDDHSFALHQFVVGRCGAHVDRGADQLFELLEAERIKQRVEYDLEMIKEFGCLWLRED